jgi:hypothetical protein
MRVCSPLKTQIRAGVAQLIKYLPCKLKALSSSTRITTTKNKQTNKQNDTNYFFSPRKKNDNASQEEQGTVTSKSVDH